MTAMTDFDRLVASWLEADGPSMIRDGVVDAAIETARAIRRPSPFVAAVVGPRPWPARSGRRIGRMPWRPAIVVGLLVVALLAVIALGGGSRPNVPLPTGVLAIADNTGLSIAGPSADGAAFPDGAGFPIAASERRRILPEGPAFDPRWSPDGAYVGVLIGGDRLRTLVVVRPDGTVVGRSALVKEYRWLGQLLLVRRDDNLIDVLRPDLLLEHGELPISVVQGGDPTNPSFDAPLADVLAVRRDHASGAINGWGGSPVDLGTIWSVTFRPGHGSGGIWVQTAGTDVRGMAWSPAEDQLAFIDTTCDPDQPAAACAGTLSMVPRTGAERVAVALAGSISAASEPVWDATGQRLLAKMMDVPGGGSALVIVHTDRAPALVSRLTFDPTDSDPRWAPGHVLFLRPRDNSSGATRDAWWVRTDLTDETRVAADVNGVDWRPTP